MALTADLGLTTLFDTFPIDIASLKDDVDQYFLQQTTTKAQLLLQQIMTLPSKKDESENIIVTLPKPVTPLPREKPLPVAPEPTRWEKFAKAKGIGKFARAKNKDRMEYDEENAEWKPLYGAHKKAKQIEKEDIIYEDKPGEIITPDFDPFQERDNKKKEKRERQKKQEEANLRHQYPLPKGNELSLKNMPAAVTFPTVVADTERELKRGMVAAPPSLKESKAAVKKMLLIAERSGEERGHDASWLEKRAQIAKAGGFNSTAYRGPAAPGSIEEGIERREGKEEEKRRVKGKKGLGKVGAVNELRETEHERDERIALSLVGRDEGQLDANAAGQRFGRIGKYTVGGDKRKRYGEGEGEGEGEEGGEGKKGGKGRGGKRKGGKKHGGKRPWKPMKGKNKKGRMFGGKRKGGFGKGKR